MFQPWGKHFTYGSTILPNLLIILPNFFHIVLDIIRTTTSSNYRPPLMCVHTPIDLMGIHLLRYTRGNEHTGTHDTIQDFFVSIVQNAGFHVGWKQLHVLPSTMLNSSSRQVNVVLIKNGICTLANVVIANLMHADLLPHSCTTQRFVTFDATQAKEGTTMTTTPH